MLEPVTCRAILTGWATAPVLQEVELPFIPCQIRVAGTCPGTELRAVPSDSSPALAPLGSRFVLSTCKPPPLLGREGSNSTENAVRTLLSKGFTRSFGIMKAGAAFYKWECGCEQDTDAGSSPDLPWAFLTAGPHLCRCRNQGEPSWSGCRQWAREPGMGNAVRRMERRQLPPPPRCPSPCTYSSLLIPLLRQSHCSRGVCSLPNSSLLVLTP